MVLYSLLPKLIISWVCILLLDKAWTNRLQLKTCSTASPFQSTLNCDRIVSYRLKHELGGTAAADPPPFRPSEPALFGSRPLVTPY